MFFAIITLITALGLASVAAAFAIFGIMAVFSGAPISALVMGTVIELGKVVGVSWIYRNWKERTMLKWVMIPIVLISMILTSLGIFGYLSKAHLEQGAPVANNSLQIERLDARIAAEQAKITDAEGVIAQLDETVNTLIRFERIRGADGSIATRANQQPQRDELSRVVSEAQTAIDGFEDQKLQLSQELRAVELEVGPIRYVAELIYEDAESHLESAVRFLIIAFIFVFDPMAILLLMAANYTLMQRSKKIEIPAPSAPSTPVVEEAESVTEEYIFPAINQQAKGSRVEKLPEAPPETQAAIKEVALEVQEVPQEQVPQEPVSQPIVQRDVITLEDIQKTRANLEDVDGRNADVFMVDGLTAKSIADGYLEQKPRLG